MPSTLRLTRSIFDTAPENSQVNRAYFPSMEKSAWLMPPHAGTGRENFSSIVVTSRKSRRLKASATTMAYFPSGDQYML